jgi:uncharacterized protein YwqG
MEAPSAVIKAIRETAAECGTPDAVVEATIHHSLPSIRLIPKRAAPRNRRRVGGSRIGGLPDLPSGQVWPRLPKRYVDGPPLSFLVQINLSEVAAFDEEKLLPDSGVLCFFFHLDPGGPDSGQVLFIEDPASGLHRTEPPSDLNDDQLFAEFELEPRLEWTVPSPYDIGFSEAFIKKHLELWDSLAENVAAAQGFSDSEQPKYRLLGHPQLIQAPGVGDGTRLLLQVDSDCSDRDEGFPQTGMTWGDAGMVYYFIGEDELRSHDFETCSTVLETH